MDLTSVKGCAEFLNVAPSTVRAWIHRGQLVAQIRNGKYWLPKQQNLEFLLNKLRERGTQPPRPYVPKEIANYHRWHTVLDEFCWLLKVTYTPRPAMRRKQFRLDQIFANYLQEGTGDIDRIAQALGPGPERDPTVSEDLRRGWYNELAFTMPLRDSLIGLSFSDIQRNQETSNARYVFPSWRIVSNYYAAYFFLRSIAIQKEPNLNIQRHSSTINAFKHNVIPVLQPNLWSFPFDIAWTPGVRVFTNKIVIAQLPHLGYNYARHPREPNRLPIESFKFVRSFFRQRARSQQKSHIAYTLIDFLRELRVWANYVDIDNLINLWGRGYRTFLDQNLSVLLFFLAGIAEVAFIAVRHERQYLEQVQYFYDRFVCSNQEVKDVFDRSPMFQRMLIYRHLGIIRGDIKLDVEADINEIMLLDDGKADALV